MTGQEYLASVLKGQLVSPVTVSKMQDTRNEIERVIRKAFGSGPRIYYAGSYGKCTMIAAYHDLDIVIYFPSSSTETLKSIYWSVYRVLDSARYILRQKDVAIRLPYEEGFSIDVVPGRAQDATYYYANLFRSETDSRLQTSIKKHIDTVKNSGHTDTLKLLKLWNVRHNLGVRSFAIELLAIRALQGKRVYTYEDKLQTIFSFLRDNIETVRLEDPANSNNIITDVISAEIKRRVAVQAQAALSASYWSHIIW